MNKRVFSLILTMLMALSLSGHAGATQFGVRLGGLLAPDGSVLSSFGAQFVANDLVGPYTDVRVIASAGFSGLGTVFQVQSNLMFRFTLDDAGNVFAYVGPGLGLLYSNGLRFSLLVRGGLEYQFTPSLSAFADLGGGYIFLQNVLYLDFAVGLNFRLIETAG
jgi:hypothetical protein